MNDNDTLADDHRKDSVALMALLEAEKRKNERLAAALDVAKRQPYLGIATNREIEAERSCRRAMGHTDPEYRTWEGERSDIDDTSKLSLRTPLETAAKPTDPAWDCACNELDCPYCANRAALKGDENG